MISDVILKELLALLNKDNIINNIKFIGVCTGPGSYTSLRIGIASAIGLSFSSNKKLYGFSAIDLLLSYAKINYKLNSVCLLIQSQNDQNFLISINKEKNTILKYQKIESDIKKNIDDVNNNTILISNEVINDKKFSFLGKFSSLVNISISEILTKIDLSKIDKDVDIIKPFYINKYNSF